LLIVSAGSATNPQLRGRVSMRRGFSIALAVMLTAGCSAAAAQAATGIDCDSFAKNADSSWTALRRVAIPGPNVRVQEGSVFRPGQTFLGEDLAARLEKSCPGATVAAPASVPPAVQAPQLSLSRFADANGNIDVQQLTCSDFVGLSPDQAGLFLAWYSGWYDGAAKRRSINVARVQYRLKNVTDYCQVNREQKLARVLENFLK
jgi:hypothetical protein